MSAKVIGLVLEHFPARDAQELAVALVLSDAADHDGTHVFPSVMRVARLSRTSERTVQRALASFKNVGFINVKRLGGGRGRVTEYEIAVDWLMCQPSVLKGDHLSPIEKKVTDDQQNGDKRVTKGCHSSDTQPNDPRNLRTTTEEENVVVIFSDQSSILCKQSWQQFLEKEIEHAYSRATPPEKTCCAYAKGILANWERLGRPALSASTSQNLKAEQSNNDYEKLKIMRGRRFRTGAGKVAHIHDNGVIYIEGGGSLAGTAALAALKKIEDGDWQVI